jgi:hypothetical protein
MVVNDFYLVDIAFPPDKAYPPLIVNADAVSARSPALQSFQAIGRRDAKVVQNSGIVEHTQLAPDHDWISCGKRREISPCQIF